MIYKLLFWIVLSFCFGSCVAQKKDNNSSFENKVNVWLDSLLIEQNVVHKLDNFKFTSHVASYKINQDSSLSLLYLANQSQIIDFNLTTGKIEKIKLVGENPVQSGFIILIKLDTLYALLNESSELFEYVHDTLRTKKSRLDTLPGFNGKEISISPDIGFRYRVPYISDSSIIFRVWDYENKRDEKTFATYNFISKEVSFFSFKLREEYFKYPRPFRDELKMELVGDTLFVCYNFSEDIDLFSLSSGKFLGSKTMKSRFQESTIPYLKSLKDDFEKERYKIETANYDLFTYNPYKKCYYRLFYHPLHRMNEKGEYTISEDQVASIAIFDQNFNWIGEQIVDKKYFWAGIIPHPEGALGFWRRKSGDNYYLSILKHD